MSQLIRITAAVMAPLVMSFGFYVVIHGHLSPGGGFQGGAVIATAVALLLVAFGRAFVLERLKKDVLAICEATGLLIFVIVGLGGLVFGSSFLHNWFANAGGLLGNPVTLGANAGDLNTAGMIAILNVAIGLEVLGGLSLVLLYMMTPEQDQHTDQAPQTDTAGGDA